MEYGSTTQSIQVTGTGIYNLTVYAANGQTGSADIDISSLDLEGCAVISGRVFEDLNNNGIDDGEPGLTGVVLRDTVSWQSASYAISQTDGTYDLFVDAFGSHSVDIFWTPTEVVCGAITSGNQTLPTTEAYALFISAGTTALPENDFGFNYGSPIDCGTISGNVFEDLNQNGTQDLGENGFQGINVKFHKVVG